MVQRIRRGGEPPNLMPRMGPSELRPKRGSSFPNRILKQVKSPRPAGTISTEGRNDHEQHSMFDVQKQL